MRVFIDPGASGGIVYTNDDGTNIRTIAMPDDIDQLCFALVPEQYGERKAYLEDLVKYTGWAMPASAMAVYASNWGSVRGILKYAGYDLELISPKAWQNAIGMKRVKKEPKPQWKKRLQAKAQELYPTLKITLSTADAVLIMYAINTGLLKPSS
jgi:hypothetical protein